VLVNKDYRRNKGTTFGGLSTSKLGRAKMSQIQRDLERL